MLVLPKEARMKCCVNDFNILPEECCLYCCPTYDISSFLLNENENMSEFNKSLSLPINNSKPNETTVLLWQMLLKLFRDVNPKVLTSQLAKEKFVFQLLM